LTDSQPKLISTVLELENRTVVENPALKNIHGQEIPSLAKIEQQMRNEETY